MIEKITGTDSIYVIRERINELIEFANGQNKECSCCYVKNSISLKTDYQINREIAGVLKKQKDKGYS